MSIYIINICILILYWYIYIIEIYITHIICDDDNILKAESWGCTLSKVEIKMNNSGKKMDVPPNVQMLMDMAPSAEHSSLLGPLDRQGDREVGRVPAFPLA